MEERISVRDPRKEVWPFAVALLLLIFAGLSVLIFLLYWAVPAFWPYQAVEYRSTVDSEKLLVLDVPFYSRSEISRTGDVVLLADERGRLEIAPFENREGYVKHIAEGVMFVAVQAGNRLLFYPESLNQSGHRISVDDPLFKERLAETLRESKSLQDEIASLQKLAHEITTQDERSEYFARIKRLRDDARESYIQGRTIRGEELEIPLLSVTEYYFNDDLSFIKSLRIYCRRILNFVSQEPSGGTTSGGIFPAIVGTFFLTIVMSVIVAPLGVVVALYLNEYAKEGVLLNWVRVAINNLAGIPSVIYGVFGLGFFVYFVGGQIDSIFYQDNLPSPTFGTGGILWASLALALMTLPVVIVSTEESLRGVPRHVRNASMALGASKWQTIWSVVLPYATPGLLTGLILAVARAAGEVAPLMLLGVTRVAPQILVSGEFPFVHFERKFMHLGYHIYDLSFHSSNNVEAVPFIFVSSLLLVGCVFFMNLAAVLVRRVLLEQQRKLGQA